MLDTELYERKKYFAAKGKFYLPLFLHELKENYKRQKIYSYMRRLLYTKFPTIYSYTGVILTKRTPFGSASFPSIIASALLITWLVSSSIYLFIVISIFELMT